MGYLENIDSGIRAYFEVLEPNFPDWLEAYVNTPRMQKQAGISVACGNTYTDLFPESRFFSSLDHSVAVALIIWHFTQDKKQTLAGLFHDIATPAFKHCVDFMNGDYITQESTEELTSKMIADSPEICELLRRDNIEISEVDDYHNYPIADNDTPQLSADRLEYTFSNAIFVYGQKVLEEIIPLYEDLEIQKNPSGEIEIGFQTKKYAREFVKISSKLSVVYREDRMRYSMQLIADILKKLESAGKIHIEDLYERSEAEMIKIIEESEYGEIFNIWRKAKKIKATKTEPKGVYYVHHGSKVRYIDPLVKGVRISGICKIAKNAIEQNLAYDMDNYVYLDEISRF